MTTFHSLSSSISFGKTERSALRNSMAVMFCVRFIIGSAPLLLPLCDLDLVAFAAGRFVIAVYLDLLSGHT
jgi:hypothetical protein